MMGSVDLVWHNITKYSVGTCDSWTLLSKKVEKPLNFSNKKKLLSYRSSLENSSFWGVFYDVTICFLQQTVKKILDCRYHVW